MLQRGKKGITRVKLELLTLMGVHYSVQTVEKPSVVSNQSPSISSHLHMFQNSHMPTVLCSRSLGSGDQNLSQKEPTSLMELQTATVPSDRSTVAMPAHPENVCPMPNTLSWV